MASMCDSAAIPFETSSAPVVLENDGTGTPVSRTISAIPVITRADFDHVWYIITEIMKKEGEDAIRPLPLSISPSASSEAKFYRVDYLEDPENTATRVPWMMIKFPAPTTTYPGGDRAVGYTTFHQDYLDTAYVIGALSRRDDCEELSFFLKHHHSQPYASYLLVEYPDGYVPLGSFLKKMMVQSDWEHHRISTYRALGRVMGQIQKCRLLGEIDVNHFVIHPTSYSIKMIDYTGLDYYGSYTEEELRSEQINIMFLQEAQMGHLISDLFLTIFSPEIIARNNWFDFKKSYFKLRFPDYYDETPEAKAKYGNRRVGEFERFLNQALYMETISESGMGERSEELTTNEQSVLVKFILFRHNVDSYFSVPGSN
jgi:hypothetical protein